MMNKVVKVDESLNITEHIEYDVHVHVKSSRSLFYSDILIQKWYPTILSIKLNPIQLYKKKHMRLGYIEFSYVEKVG